MPMTKLFLIRHAHAGDRRAWTGPDEERPLSPKGWRQARALVKRLDAEETGRIASSPSLRCTETVMPLAEARGGAVEADDRLLEGRDPADAFAMLEHELRGAAIAACTHGDLVPAILELAARSGASLPSEVRWAKGSVWVLEYDARGWGEARYIPPSTD